MSLLYASTFTRALVRLSAAEQKQVKITTVDLMLDPTGNGLQLHRVEASPGFWTARASRDLRLVLFKDGDRTLLAYVDHHDAAYRWAGSRRLVLHERTGAMQLVEVVERSEARLVAPVVDQPAFAWAPEPLPPRRPFADLTDDQLLDIGVPRSWLRAVQTAEEASVDGLFAALPDEAAEALLDVATGGRLADHIAVRPRPVGDPFTHPDAQRRFRILDDVDALRAALEQPFETWAVFLHPAQRALVERPQTGPARVSGSAGTGKTIVALHRAVHLAREDRQARLLLTTFSGPLAASLSRKLAVLTQGDASLREGIAVQPLDGVAFALHTAAFGQPSRVTSSQVRAAIADARKAGLGGSHAPAFLFEKWTDLVDAWDVADAETYATLPRVGRRTRLGVQQREAAWAVFAFVRQRLADRGVVTDAQIYARLTRWLIQGGRLPYSHVVVDEAQDLSVAQVRFLAAIGGGSGSGDALFLAGDIGQRIFHLPFSWARLGLDLRGRSHCLKVNYRTSHQIRVAADRLLPTSITDMDGVEEGRRGTVSVFDGPAPELLIAADEAAERAGVVAFLARCGHDGIGAAETGVLVRGQGQLGRARAAVRAAGHDPRDTAGVAIVTMHDAKGLEFRAVVVMACDDDVLPDPARLAAIDDSADLDAVYDTERHLLYVAATRARDRLMVSAVAPGSDFLRDLAP